MRRSLLRFAMLLAVVTACVPSTQSETEPRGAAGARMIASPAARGTAFTTSDGWTITIERVALVALVTAVVPLDGERFSRFLIWDGARATETYLPAIRIGTVAVQVAPLGLDRGPGHDPSAGDYDVRETLAQSALAPEVQARVLGAPDNTLAAPAGYDVDGALGPGPAVIFAAVAMKDARTVRIALALASAYPYTPDPAGVQPLAVQENDVRYAAFEVRPERIFAATADDAATLFEPFAAADRDRDGIVTADELRATPLPTAPADATAVDAGTSFAPEGMAICSAASDPTSACLTLLDRIADNAQHMFIAEGAP